MSNPKLLSIDELIGFQVQCTADWRRDKAKQFSDDARNLEAAEELDALAAKIRSLEGSEIHRQICELTDRLFESDEDCFNLVEDLNEDVSSALRDVGFRGGFNTGTEFLEWYRDLLQEKLHDGLDETVSVPDLYEEVANDPTVKAAKQAYDEARTRKPTPRRARNCNRHSRTTSEKRSHSSVLTRSVPSRIVGENTCALVGSSSAT